MTDRDNASQESKTERVALLCTPEEKHAIRLLSAARKISETDLIRAHLDFAAIMADYERIKPALADVA